MENHNVHVYSYKEFSEDYYPAEDFNFDRLKKQTETEQYFQIEFNSDITTTKPDDIANKYQEISAMIESFKVEVFNQFNPSRMIIG